MNLPSLKLNRTTVVTYGSDDKTEAAYLRARLKELERTPEDLARVEAERYANALLVERHGALLKLAHCEAQNPDEHEEEMVFHPNERPSLERVRLSWGERAAEARAHVTEIDAEISRVA